MPSHLSHRTWPPSCFICNGFAADDRGRLSGSWVNSRLIVTIDTVRTVGNPSANLHVNEPGWVSLSSPGRDGLMLRGDVAFVQHWLSELLNAPQA